MGPGGLPERVKIGLFPCKLPDNRENQGETGSLRTAWRATANRSAQP
jgi:hypothetical protein